MIFLLPYSFLLQSGSFLRLRDSSAIWWIVSPSIRHLPIIELAMWRVCMYVSHVLDRKLLERLMSPSPKRRLCSRPHSNESVIFWDSYFSSYGEFVEFSLRFTAPLSGRSLSNKAAHHITAAKIGDAGCI